MCVTTSPKKIGKTRSEPLTERNAEPTAAAGLRGPFEDTFVAVSPSCCDTPKGQMEAEVSAPEEAC